MLPAKLGGSELRWGSFGMDRGGIFYLIESYMKLVHGGEFLWEGNVKWDEVR